MRISPWRFAPLHLSNAGWRVPYSSLWHVEAMVPGGRQHLSVTDDFGNLVKVDREATLYSMYSRTAH